MPGTLAWGERVPDRAEPQLVSGLWPAQQLDDLERALAFGVRDRDGMPDSGRVQGLILTRLRPEVGRCQQLPWYPRGSLRALTGF
jgi:hypothetical protein